METVELKRQADSLVQIAHGIARQVQATSDAPELQVTELAQCLESFMAELLRVIAALPE